MSQYQLCIKGLVVIEEGKFPLRMTCEPYKEDKKTYKKSVLAI